MSVAVYLPKLEAPEACVAVLIPVQQRGLRLTIVAKVTFRVCAGEVKTLAPPVKLITGDWYNQATGSLISASDLAPAMPGGEVLVAGHAYSAGGPKTLVVAALRVGREASSDIRKRIDVVGQRPNPQSSPTPFQKMALVWERAVLDDNNPAGVNQAVGMPNLLNPANRAVSTNFGPIAPLWPARQTTIAPHAPPRLDLFPIDLPDNFDPTFFLSAPEDQQLRAMHGDEWVTLQGLHPQEARVQFQLPRVRMEAVLSDFQAPSNVVLAPDRLVIDTDQQLCTLTYRASFAFDWTRPTNARVQLKMLRRGEVQLTSALDVAALKREALPFANLGQSALPPKAVPVQSQETGTVELRIPVEAIPEKVLQPVAIHATAPLDASMLAAERAKLPFPEPQRERVARPTPFESLPFQDLRPPKSPPPEESKPEPEPKPISHPTPPRSPPNTETGMRKLVLDNVRANVAMHGIDLSGADLQGLDLTGAILSDARLTGAKLNNTIMRNARLTRAKLMKTDLTGADLSNADLAHADLSRSMLSRAILSGANLSDATLAMARADSARLDGVHADRAKLPQAQLDGAVLTRASLRDSDMSGASLARASFVDAVLTGARMSDVLAEAVVLTGATLDGATFAGAILVGAQLDGAGAERTTWDRANLSQARFDSSRMVGASLSKAKINGASFVGADLTRADLSTVSAEGADFSHANLTSAELRMSRLAGARFDEACLVEINAQKITGPGVRFANANLRQAILRGSNLKGCDVSNAQLEGCDLRDTDMENANIGGADLTRAKTAGAVMKNLRA